MIVLLIPSWLLKRPQPSAPDCAYPTGSFSVTDIIRDSSTQRRCGFGASDLLICVASADNARAKYNGATQEDATDARR